jgi:hypothetical protein
VWVRPWSLVQWTMAKARLRALPQACLRHAQFLLCVGAFHSSVLFPLPSLSQDRGSASPDFHGNSVEITVSVLDNSGQPLYIPAMVKLYRDGTIPSGQSETSRGQAVFVVNNTGQFTVQVKASGYADTQKTLWVQATGRAQLDVYVPRISGSENSATPPGRPILAPKAREAFDKALQALAADKLEDAEKYVRKVVQLAPAHPDVLYVQGLLFMKQRNWPQAQISLEKATQIDPTHAPAFAALGMTLCDQGKFEAAIPPLEKSLQIEQAQQSATPSQAEKEQSERPPRDKSPQSESASKWQMRWTLAQAYYHHEQYDQALQMSQQALTASRGKAPEIALLVAQSLAAVGRYEDAAQTLRDFLRDHPQQPQAPTAQRWLDRLTTSGKIARN